MKTYYLINNEWIDIATDPRYIVYGNGLFGLYEDKNKVLLQKMHPSYIECDRFNEGRAIVKDRNNLYGYIDKSGALICPCRYQKVSPYHNGVAIVYDGFYHVIDYNGNMIIKDNFISIEYFGDNDKYLQCNDEYGNSKIYLIRNLIGKYHYHKEEISTELIVYKSYTGKVQKSVVNYYDGYAAFSLDGIWGVIDSKDNIVEQFIHRKKIIPHDNMLIFMENNALNIVDLKTSERKQYDNRLYEAALNYLRKKDYDNDVHIIAVDNNSEVRIDGIISVNQNVIELGVDSFKQKRKCREKDNSNNIN